MGLSRVRSEVKVSFDLTRCWLSFVFVSNDLTSFFFFYFFFWSFTCRNDRMGGVGLPESSNDDVRSPSRSK